MTRTREDCLRDFNHCVETLRAGVKDDTAHYLRKVRARLGQEVAEACKREIIAYAKSGKPCPKV